MEERDETQTRGEKNRQRPIRRDSMDRINPTYFIINGRRSVETAGVNKMSRKEDERRSTEAGEKQSETRVRRSSINKDTPNFSHDADRPADSSDSKRDAHR